MRTYSLITKPYRIRIKPGFEHTLINPLTNKGITFSEGTEFWCAKAYSQDHVGYMSLFVFNHSTYTTFKIDSAKMREKWDIVECNKDWRDEMSLLQVSLLGLNLFTDGTIPKFVPEKEEN